MPGVAIYPHDEESLPLAGGADPEPALVVALLRVVRVETVDDSVDLLDAAATAVDELCVSARGVGDSDERRDVSV